MKSQNKPFRILIADDHSIVRSGLRNLIETNADLEVAGEAADGEQVVEFLNQNSIDLITLDLSLPKINGLQLIDLIKRRFPRVKILVLTMHKEREFFRKAVAKGVAGYILKDDLTEKLLTSILEIREGRQAYTSELMTYLVGDFTAQQTGKLATELLTKREIQVLKGIAQGHANKEIAGTLGIGIRTIETHRKNLIEKLNLKSVAALTKYAIDNDLLDS